MFLWLSFCILTVSEDLSAFSKQGKGTPYVYLYILIILSPFPKCNLLDFDAFYIISYYDDKV